MGVNFSGPELSVFSSLFRNIDVYQIGNLFVNSIASHCFVPSLQLVQEFNHSVIFIKHVFDSSRRNLTRFLSDLNFIAGSCSEHQNLVDPVKTFEHMETRQTCLNDLTSQGETHQRVAVLPVAVLFYKVR